jgi:single-strand DNA-binding protein
MNDPRITLPIARLAADPERKQTRNGTPYMLIRVAATGGHMDKTTKQWVDHDTMWATIFEYDLRLAETYERMLRKGTPVRVEGVLKWKTGTDNQGQPRTDFIIEHATISLSMLKAKNQQTGNQWPGTSGREPTRSARPTRSTRPTTNGTCSKWQ